MMKIEIYRKNSKLDENHKKKKKKKNYTISNIKYNSLTLNH